MYQKIVASLFSYRVYKKNRNRSLNYDHTFTFEDDTVTATLIMPLRELKKKILHFQ